MVKHSESDASLPGALAAHARFAMLPEAPVFEGRPMAEAAVQLKDELLFQRATQTGDGSPTPASMLRRSRISTRRGACRTSSR